MSVLMDQVNGTDTKQAKAMTRLLPHIVDDFAANEPCRPFQYQPRSNNPQDGWSPVTFKEFANAIDHVAHIIAESVKKDGTDSFPTLGYIGPNDVRYGIMVLASVKAGCRALLVSPRNSTEVQLSLFERTSCHHVWYTESLHPVVQTWLGRRKMKSWTVPRLQDWLHASTTPFPYTKTFEEARWDPLVVLHTSGSTGLPKPIVVRQGAPAVLDMFRDLPTRIGSKFVLEYCAASATRIFMPMPLFHAAGLILGMLGMGIYYGLPGALPLLDQPLTPDLALTCLRCSGSDSTFLAPSIVEELSLMADGVQELKKLRFVAFGGGNLSKTAGDSLVKDGVVLTSYMGSTEMYPYAVYFQTSPQLWQYFIFNSEVMGAEWRPHDPENSIYELAVRRKDPNEPLDQPLFYTFPELMDWSTGDLFQAHPTLKDHWMYHGRVDNIIVFSNGEKLNPVTIEDAIVGHPLIKGAVVVGQDRFQAALILEPATPPTTEEESRAIINSVWPLIDGLNKQTVTHGRISKHLIALSEPGVPFPRASKGTVQRASTMQVYKSKIDELYKLADLVDMADVEPLDLTSVHGIMQGIMQLLTTRIGVANIAPATDFFSVGVDSLQVLSLSRFLRSGLIAAGMESNKANIDVTPRAIYYNPTAERLAQYLCQIAQTSGGGGGGGGGGPRVSRESKELVVLDGLVSKYTTGLPAPEPSKPKPLDDGQTVILTGSTGSLGGHLLDTLCKSPRVARIIALNRDQDGGKTRQLGASASRGLGADFSKVEFLHADVSRHDLGLGVAKYKDILATADRIVHNAWPVNFNMSVSSFEPHIRGVRNLVDVSARAAKQVPVIFLSSISTASNWSSSEAVPEQRLAHLALAERGYGQSKLAGSLILDAAADISGIPSVSIRVGQIAGPRGQGGKWNPREFLPSLVASSVYLGLLPRELGQFDAIDWVTIEDVARLVLDVAGITQTKDLSDVNGYFHCVNPQLARWADLVGVIRDFYGHRIREIVSLRDWVAALEESAADTASVRRNPAMKLLDTYRGFEAGREHVYFDMRRTVRSSSTAADLRPVTTTLMRNWCAQWGFS